MVKTLKNSGVNNMDAVSFHPYSMGRLSPEKTDIIKQFKFIKSDL